jgi:hypothetical protein
LLSLYSLATAENEKREERVVKTILFAGAALAVLAFSLPADARNHAYRRAYAHAHPHAYWGDYAPYYSSPFYRGRGLYYERDPFIRGQILRDLPLKDRMP